MSVASALGVLYTDHSSLGAATLISSLWSYETCVRGPARRSVTTTTAFHFSHAGKAPSTSARPMDSEQRNRGMLRREVTVMNIRRRAMLTGIVGLFLSGSPFAQEVAVVPLPFYVEGHREGHRVCVDPVERPALQAYDPAFSAAEELSTALVKSGFFIQCIAPSRRTGMFDGQVGAALFSTRQGTFEALFVPGTHTFDALQIVERRERARYRYSFGGQPRHAPAKTMDSSRPLYFFKQANWLLVASDKETAARLEAALTNR